MTINLEEKWQHLLQRARDFWADLTDEDMRKAESGKDHLIDAVHQRYGGVRADAVQEVESFVDRQQFEEDFARAQFRDREEAPAEAPDPAAAAGAYRSKPNPAFGSRSAAQRRADEQEQEAREEKASMAAARHSQQRHDSHGQGHHSGHQASGSGPDKHHAPGRH